MPTHNILYVDDEFRTEPDDDILDKYLKNENMS